MDGKMKREEYEETLKDLEQAFLKACEFKWLISYLACLYADTAKCSFYFYGRCASDYLYRKKYADLSCNASYIWNTSRMSV